MYAAIIKQIESLGYAVSVQMMDEYIEMHAVRLTNPDEQHIARNADGVGENEMYLTACVLAEMVGIELEDG
jgi:hypothetical protein